MIPQEHSPIDHYVDVHIVIEHNVSERLLDHLELGKHLPKLLDRHFVPMQSLEKRLLSQKQHGLLIVLPLSTFEVGHLLESAVPMTVEVSILILITDCFQKLLHVVFNSLSVLLNWQHEIREYADGLSEALPRLECLF